MSPEATISFDHSKTTVVFRSLHINPAGGLKDCDGYTDIFAIGGTIYANESLVDGSLIEARILPGEPPEALTLDGEPVTEASKEQILPEKSTVHLMD